MTEKYKKALVKIYINGLNSNRKELLDFAISKGLSIDKHKEYFYCYCVDNYIFDSLKLLPISNKIYNYFVIDNDFIDIKDIEILDFERMSCCRNVQKITINNATIHSLKGLENFKQLKLITILEIKNKGEGIITQLKEFGEIHNVEIKDLSEHTTINNINMDLTFVQRGYLELHEFAHIEMNNINN